MIKKIKKISLYKRIAQVFKEEESFTIREAYEQFPDEKTESIRARIYENLGSVFIRIGRGIYKVLDNIYVAMKGENSCIVIEGDGRDTSNIKSNTFDAIISDHGWLDVKSNRGGSRRLDKGFACFNYEQKDFNEKARILKDGHFLVEILPAENANNFKYLHSIKMMAEKAGLNYYSKVDWIKVGCKINMGRKVKNSESVYFFVKGKARNLRKDKKRTKSTGKEMYMSGTNGILPAEFEFKPVDVKDRLHFSEKPKELIKSILSYITLENELVYDAGAGSGVVGDACLESNRSSVLVEIMKEHVTTIVNRLNCIKLKDALDIIE